MNLTHHLIGTDQALDKPPWTPLQGCPFNFQRCSDLAAFFAQRTAAWSSRPSGQWPRRPKSREEPLTVWSTLPSVALIKSLTPPLIRLSVFVKNVVPTSFLI